MPGTPVTVDETDSALSAGANTITLRTVPDNRVSTVKRVLAAYTGTISGVTLQLLANGIPVGNPVGVATSGELVELLSNENPITLGPGETFQISVAGATANDDLRYIGFFEEEVA